MEIQQGAATAALIDEARVRHQLDPYKIAESYDRWEDRRGFLLACAEGKNFQADYLRRGLGIACCPESDVRAVFWGRLGNYDQLANLGCQLGVSSKGCAVTRVILAAWHRWGDKLLEHIEGEFALVVFDPRNRRVFLARDVVGIKPLYYRFSSGVFSFATSIPALEELGGSAMEPCLEWASGYLVGMSVSHTATAFRGVYKVPPAHQMLVESPGSKPQRYFSFCAAANESNVLSQKWVDDYRSRLEEAIQCRIDSKSPLGSETTGGLDSSTITGWVAKLLGPSGVDRLCGFGFILQERDPLYILQTSALWSIKTCIFPATGVEDANPALEQRTLSVLGHPFEHGSSVNHDVFYQECERQGIRTLFSGFGGDEVVTSPGGRLWSELIQQKRFRVIWNHLPGNFIRRPRLFLKVLKTHGTLPDKNVPHLVGFRKRWEHRIVSDEVVTRLNPIERYSSEFAYANLHRINDLALARLSHPFVATRLESCTLMAASYGVEYEWPLLDIGLIQQYLATPSLEKARWGMGRYLHRRAIEGIVPKKIQWFPSKDMGRWITPSQPFEDVVEEALRESDSLHPFIEPLVDKRRLAALIERTRKDSASEGLAHEQLRWHSNRLRWLNRWLFGLPSGS